MPADSRFRDAADRPEASCPPARVGDSLEDRLLEIAEMALIEPPRGVKFEAGASRKSLAAMAARVIQTAAREGVLAEFFDQAKPQTEMVTRVLAELIDAKNARLQAKCLAFVMGCNLSGGKSEMEIAREEGVGKAAVSKRCIRIREAFGLPPSRAMKSDAARESYRARQIGRRARPARLTWAFAGLLGRAYAAA